MTRAGSKIYLFGGSDISEESSELMVFDTETLYWSKPSYTGEAPGFRRAHCAELVNDKIYVFGGGDGPSYYNDLFVLDIHTMCWSQPDTNGTSLGPRRAHSSVLMGDKIIVFGGGNGTQPLNETYVLDTTTHTWTEWQCSGSIPSARGYHSCFQVDDHTIAIYGGSDGKSCFGDLNYLDIQSKVWTKQRLFTPDDVNGGLPPARMGHTCTVVGNRMLLFGGLNGTDYVSELLILDLSTLEWSISPLTPCSHPEARAYHSATPVGQRLFIFGGYDSVQCFDGMYFLDLGTLSPKGL